MGSCYSKLGKGNTDSDKAVTQTEKQRRGSSSGTGRWNKSKDVFLLKKKPAHDAELHQISGRIFTNAATKIACLHTQQGKKGTNQDAMLVWEVQILILTLKITAHISVFYLLHSDHTLHR